MRRVYIGGEPLSIEATWAKFLRSAGHWAMLDFSYWVVREKANGLLVGEVGFGCFKRGLADAFDQLPEIGWALMPQFHGQGYATEAVLAALARLEQYVAASRTVCLMHPENIASIRLAHNMGYREFDRASYHGDINILLERRVPRVE